MDIKHVMFIVAITLVAGCTQTTTVHHVTRDCMYYRSMMTVPIPPDITDNLKEKCERPDDDREG